MSRRLPPLNWLRAFEAAARHVSFTAAAQELNVTAAAVSQHVKALEQYLGVALFRRVHQGLHLTDAGQAYWPQLCMALDLIDRATRELAHAPPHLLTVRAPSSLSIQWLTPRLERFTRRYPDSAIRLTALGPSGEVGQNGVDLEIRYGNGQWPGLTAELLLREQVFPVCSPALAALLHSPADLVRQTLLHVVGPPDYAENWPVWLRAAGVEERMGPGLSFDQSVTALQAAVNGLGVALGRSPLVERELAAGLLVAPFALRLTSREGYWIVYPPATGERGPVRAFREWLLEEAGEG